MLTPSWHIAVLMETTVFCNMKVRGYTGVTGRLEGRQGRRASETRTVNAALDGSNSYLSSRHYCAPISLVTNQQSAIVRIMLAHRVLERSCQNENGFKNIDLNQTGPPFPSVTKGHTVLTMLVFDLLVAWSEFFHLQGLLRLQSLISVLNG